MSTTSSNENSKYSYRRYRKLARSLHARCFASTEGQLYLVNGEPDFEKLWKCLVHMREAPSGERIPSPTDLGFGCVEQLTTHRLNASGVALTKWSRALDHEEVQMHPNKCRRQQLARERIEIKSLKSRLAQCFSWGRQNLAASVDQLRVSCAAHDNKNGYLLGINEVVLTERLANIEEGQALSLLCCWFARVVLWIAGPDALSRYLHGISPLLRPGQEIVHVEQIRKLLQQLRVWKHRVKWERAKSLHMELRERISQLPPGLAAAGQISARLRGKSFSEHCDLLIERCQTLLVSYQEAPMHQSAAALAALASCDCAKSNLPKRLSESCFETGSVHALDSTVRALFEESRMSGYDKLLVAIDEFDELPAPLELSHIRCCLVHGANINDIKWTIRENLLSVCTGKVATPAWAFHVSNRLYDAGLPTSDDRLKTLVAAVKQRRDQKVMDEMLRWLSIPSSKTYTPRIRRLVEAAVFDLVLPGMADLCCHERLYTWAQCPNDSAFSKTVHQWLQRIAHYQRQAGVKPSVPKSVRKLLGKIAKNQQEVAYLRRQADSHCASQSQHARLRYLEHHARCEHTINESHVIRAAEEAFVVAAIEALRSMIRRSAADIWSRRIGIAPPNVSLSQMLKLAKWMKEMEDCEREMLRQVVESSHEHGNDYKAHLPRNRAWLAKAEKRGIDVAAWLGGHILKTAVDDRRVQIRVVIDPISVFQMGSYFGTCLSLGQFNEMSVLANAHDANKQVIFIYDESGNVLSRQLVAISSDFKLIGYHCYTGIDHRQIERRDKYIAAMAEFCGQWAQHCNLSLADEGEPDSLGDHFWYDDGSHAWHEAAKEAWKAEKLNRDCIARSFEPELEQVPLLLA